MHLFLYYTKIETKLSASDCLMYIGRDEAGKTNNLSF